MLRVLILALFLHTASAEPVSAEDVYQSPESFVQQSLQNPVKKTLTINEDIKNKVKKIMGSYYRLGPTSYWTENGKTVWILEEIGKYEPITTGFVINDKAKLERVKVLIYRESHGWEVKHDFFTDQFKGAGLHNPKRLDKRIDGIAGATLSVNALKRLSALALMLHQEVSSGS